ncbi:hypothetical protein K457DRAFT_129255 [Linnemannia elongata AG-77]|uniref:F-box domain-containing protein n=1 Tax=Linnemannia elongata AG-77 TaxID=1314771 RepID=A0A197JJ32_9FUNG|nr:hypothetical protein K457DRAFT_129255 [Linnemannia elongata AG-77]
MKTESKTPSPRHELDKHVPAEIWERIFSYLYPSQLCRFSMVNKTFETIVSSLPIWRYLFTENTFRKRLRFLRGIPESKSYMLYICANSLHICEECGYQHRFGSKNLADLPLPVLVRLSESHCSSDEEIVFSDEEIVFSDEEIEFPDEQIESSDEQIESSDEKIKSLDEEVESLDEETESLEENFEYLGSQVNLTWTVRKCCDCRKAQGEGLGSGEFEATVPRTSPPPLPKTAPEWCKIYPGFKRIVDFEGYGYDLYVNEDTVLSELEIYYGGALGAEASGKSALEYDGKTKARILWYRQQD